MTKTEQTRLWTWRVKVLQRAGESSRNVAQTVAISAFHGRPSTSGRSGSTYTGRPACAIVRGGPRSPLATPTAVVSKILICGKTYHFGPGKIADYLNRFDEIAVARVRAPDSRASWDQLSTPLACVTDGEAGVDGSATKPGRGERLSGPFSLLLCTAEAQHSGSKLCTARGAVDSTRVRARVCQADSSSNSISKRGGKRLAACVFDNLCELTKGLGIILLRASWRLR